MITQLSAFNDRGILFEEVRREQACCLVDDVRWEPSTERFVGSFLWNGIPTTFSALMAFTRHVLSASALQPPSVVVGVASSGIAWATAVALAIERPLAVVRLARHRYGPWNAGIEVNAGRQAWLIDNFYGSGDTMREASALLADVGIEITLTAVVEASDAAPTSVCAALRLRDKLVALRSVGYFDSLGDEVVERYLQDPATWLYDSAWVREVKARLACNPTGGVMVLGGRP